MARLIAVSIDCRNEAARQTFEDIVSRRRDYLVTKGQGTGAADILLLELDELRPQHTFSHIRALLGTTPELEVFLTATRTDPQVLLEAFRLGVKEFLPQPLTRQEVDAALTRFDERFRGRNPIADTKVGMVVSVLGARGGIGTSTVTTNLAMSVRQAKQRESVALVDLDMHGGDLGLFLDLQAPRGLKHLSADVSRLDETIVQSTLARHSTGLHLLASGYDGFGETEPVPGSALRVIDLLRSTHRHVFVDCGHVLEPAVKEALDCSDKVIVVTTLALSVIRRTKRLLEVLRNEHASPGKLVVVVNRYVDDHKELLAETEDMLGIRMGGLIPNDYVTTNEAINHGKPLTVMASRTSIAQWYLQGTDQFIGERADASGATLEKAQDKKGSFLGRCFASIGLETRRKPSVV